MIYLLWILLALCPATDSLTLILNSENGPHLPRHFRKEEALQASGSGQFSENGLKAILEQLPKNRPITIVDLRQESHGFVNGTAVSWYATRDAANVGRSLQEIETDEAERLQCLLKEKNITVQRILSKPEDRIEKSQALPFIAETVMTEKQLTEKYKVGYIRIPVTDHLPPTEEQLNRFREFVNNLPPQTWLHFHCEAGEGRTTTFLTLYDILRTGKKEPLDAIIRRQYEMGGIDLREPPSQGSWKYPYAIQREKVVEKFYNH